MLEVDKKNIPHGDSFGLNPDLVHFLCEAIDQKDITRIKDHVASMHSADLADFINQSSPEQREILLEVIRNHLDPAVLIDLEGEVKPEVMEQLGAKKSAEALAQLDPDDAVQVIEDLQKDDQQEILEAISDSNQRSELEQSLAYPEDSAGRLMEQNFVAIPGDWNVGQTIDFLRNEEHELPSDFYQIFVVDEHNRPTGAVLVSRVLRNKRDVEILDIMQEDLRLINVNTDQEEVAYMFRKYALASSPVVDDTGKMVGVISVDDIVDVMDEEAEEDILHLGGIMQSDLFSSFFKTTGKRFPWLFINLFTALAGATVISMFEATIEKLVALAVMMPIIASLAGNAGTQALTIAVRGLATKELTATNARRILLKEIFVGLSNGLLFATIVGTVSYLYYGNLNLSLVFASAVIGTLLVAGLAGTVIPLILSRMKIDPAIASGVFLTTMTDALAFFIFLGLATWWLIN